MECDICLRAPSTKLPFYCPSCARTTLYGARIRTAQVLVEAESLSDQIERITSPNGKQSGGDETAEGASRKWIIETSNVKRTQAKDRIKSVSQPIKVLREEIAAARREISERRAALQQKQEQQRGLVNDSFKGQEVQKSQDREAIQKASSSWESLYHKSIETRSFLCREAAYLYGLRQKRKLRAGEVHDQYTIGGVPIFDLRDINPAKCSDLSTSLLHVSRLVVLVAHYLSVRLPAEITLPHRNYPLPTIFTPSQSYQNRSPPFPGTTPSSSQSSSPISSRHHHHHHQEKDPRPLPRPRPLFIDPENPKSKTLHVAKRDPNAFAYFLEAIGLLAWDVAWLCRSQGMTAGTESWEQVCDVGRNLYELLLGRPSSAPNLLRVADRVASPTVGPSEGPSRAARLGQFSHGSAHSFPGKGAIGDFVKGWRVEQYTMVVDPLKRVLVGEMMNAEWQVVEEAEWEWGEAAEKAIKDNERLLSEDTIQGMKGDDQGKGEPKRTGDGEEGRRDESGPEGRVKGTTGWTKLKTRDNLYL